MSNLILTFNGPAQEVLGPNTRIRVKTMKRGGQEYVALRPSYRVSGKNAMIRAVKNDDGTMSAELPDTLVGELSLPDLKGSHTYKMHDAGYGWYLIQDAENLVETDATITVTRSRKSSKRKAAGGDETVADATQESQSEPSEDLPREVVLPVKTEDTSAAEPLVPVVPQPDASSTDQGEPVAE